MDELLSVDNAIARILKAAPKGQQYDVSIENAISQVLAHDILAHQAMPAFDRAMLDGFAVLAKDTESASKDKPVMLVIHEQVIGAGFDRLISVEKGHGIRTMTGAPLMQGVDAIVRFEHAHVIDSDGHSWLIVTKPVQKGEAVQAKGYEVMEGETLVKEGTKLGVAELALLAAQGIREVAVIRPPSIGVIATGSELIASEEAWRFGKLYDSNALMITNLLRTWGYHATRFLSVQDEREVLSYRLQEAMEASDLLITTGGVSVGDFDLVPSVLEALGVERLFWGVWMRPGTPLYAGKKGDKIIMAMSGNPGAAIVHAIVFLPTLLAHMTNLHDQSIGALQKGILARTIENLKPVKHTRFLRGRWYLKDGHVFVEPHDDQSSGTLRSYCQANALLRIEASQNLAMGTLVSFLSF